MGGVHCYQEIELILCIKLYSDCMGFDLGMWTINMQIEKNPPVLRTAVSSLLTSQINPVLSKILRCIFYKIKMTCSV